MKVIALTGRAGSGKDTAARGIELLTGAIEPPVPMGCPFYIDAYLTTNWHTTPDALYHWPTLKFAYPVYQIGAILVGRDVEDIMSDPNFKNQVQAWGLTGRQLLQKIGTECFREVIGKMVWVDVMENTLSQLEKLSTTGVIISDLRFVNEADYLINRGATIIKLGGRDGDVGTSHPSEAEISDIQPDYLIDNSGSYVDLMDGLAAICKELNIFNCKYTWK